MIDKILAILGFIVAVMFVIAGCAVMASMEASGIFLLAAGVTIAYGSTKLLGGPVRPFEDQYRDYGGY